MGVPDPFTLALVSAAIGGSIGGLMSFLVQRWKYNIDRWTAITDELCREIVHLGDIASEFWLLERTPANNVELSLKQLKVRGSMARIDALKAPFEDWCTRGGLKRFASAHGDFIDIVSGGEFTAATRGSSPETAFRIQQAAADTVAAVRYSLRDGLGISAARDRLFRKG